MRCLDDYKLILYSTENNIRFYILHNGPSQCVPKWVGIREMPKNNPRPSYVTAPIVKGYADEQDKYSVEVYADSLSVGR